MGKPGNVGNRVQVNRITGNQETANVFDNCRESSTNRRSFFKTNPIFLTTRIIASSVLTKGYRRIAACGDQKSKAKQSQLPAFWPEARSTKCQILNGPTGCGMTVLKRSCNTEPILRQRGGRGGCSLRRCCLLASRNRSSPSLPSCGRVTDTGPAYAILELSPISKNNMRQLRVNPN